MYPMPGANNEQRPNVFQVSMAKFQHGISRFDSRFWLLISETWQYIRIGETGVCGYSVQLYSSVKVQYISCITIYFNNYKTDA